VAPHPFSDPELKAALGVMAISLAVTFFLVRYLNRLSKLTGNLILESDALHYRTDLLTNGGILIALVIIKFTGWHPFDAIIALGLSVYIALAALPLLRKGLAQLLDRALDPELVDEIRRIAEGHSPLVNGMHELRTRKSGDLHFVEFHLVFNEDIPLGRAHRVADEIEARIRALKPLRWSINVHLDPVDDSHHDRRLEAAWGQAAKET
jgi:cation diffusion facilitator family transporter